MTPELIKTVGQIAGIGGLSLMVFYFLFKDIIRKSIFPKLKEENAYRLLRQIVWIIFIVTLAGMGTWMYGTHVSSKQLLQLKAVVEEPVKQNTVTNTGKNTGVISGGDISVDGDLVVGGSDKK